MRFSLITVISSKFFLEIEYLIENSEYDNQQIKHIVF